MDQATDLSVFVRHPADGVSAMDLVVDGVYCGACIVTIEKGLERERGVRGARVNLASKRVTVEWDDGALAPSEILRKLDQLGYPAYPFAAPLVDSLEAEQEKRLLRCLGVAAFGAMNVMLLSVALWAGAESDNNGATRDLFHWFSALVAIPTVAYAGRPFFDSALSAVRQRATNMDVPITIGVVLSVFMSVVLTVQHASETYFESGVMLLMFLLAGRALDQRMRRRTRDVATNLAAMKAEKAVKVTPARRDGGDADRGDPAGRSGAGAARASASRSTASSKTDARRSTRVLSPARPRRRRRRPGPWFMPARSTSPAPSGCASSRRPKARCIDEVNSLLEKAIELRSSYVQLADRAARLYAPFVQLTALVTFASWMALGMAWQPALIIAITVLIITCPCALGLAVPAVQVVAASAMFRRSRDAELG